MYRFSSDRKGDWLLFEEEVKLETRGEGGRDERLRNVFNGRPIIVKRFEGEGDFFNSKLVDIMVGVRFLEG